jgi:hypothetical protein
MILCGEVHRLVACCDEFAVAAGRITWGGRIRRTHTAAALRPDRHHTHGHQVAIVGWHLYEPYTLQTFCMNSSCPGRPMSANYSLVHAPYMSPCTKL